MTMRRTVSRLLSPLLLAALALGCGDSQQEQVPTAASPDDDTDDDDDPSGTDDDDDPSGPDDDDDPSGPDDDDVASPADDDEPGIGVNPITGCEAPAPGPAPLRRLSNAEYRNTLVDLLGDEALVEQVTASFPREPVSLGFRNAADSLRVNELLADQYLQAASELAEAVPDIAGLVPCAVDAFDHECAEQFIRDFGHKVYRRELKEAEVQRYANLYQVALDDGNDFRTSLEWLASALFSSPHFLFRVELSQPTEGSVVRPSGYEMASRLSYLLWQTMPDEELFRAAEAGELSTAEGIEAQVLRMVANEKALRVYEFFEQWMDIDEMEGVSRSSDVYPEADATLLRLFEAENRAFIYALLTNNGTFADMVSGQYTYANQSLAEHYGLSQVPEGGTFERVDAPGRAGILTQGMLTVHDRTTRTSIVRRGLKIRTDVLCQLVPAPPDNVDLTLPELDGSLSQRERLELHRVEPSCATCHDLIDPIGEIFEGFDALGRDRTADEAGGAVLTTGSVKGVPGLDGDYQNVNEFAAALAENDVARECFVRQAFRFFYGRDATSADECTSQQLLQSFARRDYRVVDLLMGLTQSDQFLYRGAEEELQ